MIKCSFCGYEFDEGKAKKGCGGCPLSKSCGRTKCPNCGYEIPEEPALIKYIRKRWGAKK